MHGTNWRRGYQIVRLLSGGHKVYVPFSRLASGRLHSSHRCFRRASQAEEYRIRMERRYLAFLRAAGPRRQKLSLWHRIKRLIRGLMGRKS